MYVGILRRTILDVRQMNKAKIKIIFVIYSSILHTDGNCYDSSPLQAYRLEHVRVIWQLTPA